MPCRPRNSEQKRRRQEFVRLIQTGADFAEAAQAAKLAPVRALAILSEQPEVRQIVAHFLNPQPEDLAA